MTLNIKGYPFNFYLKFTQPRCAPLSHGIVTVYFNSAPISRVRFVKSLLSCFLEKKEKKFPLPDGN